MNKKRLNWLIFISTLSQTLCVYQNECHDSLLRLFRRGVQIFGARRSMWMTSFLAPPRLLVPYWAESAPSWFSSLSSAVILTLNAKIARSRATLIPVLLSVSPVFLPNPFRLCLTCLNLKLWLSAYLNTIHFFQTNYFHKYVSISVYQYLII